MFIDVIGTPNEERTVEEHTYTSISGQVKRTRSIAGPFVGNRKYVDYHHRI